MEIFESKEKLKVLIKTERKRKVEEVLVKQTLLTS
jgi:hypothetical protein